MNNEKTELRDLFLEEIVSDNVISSGSCYWGHQILYHRYLYEITVIKALTKDLKSKMIQSLALFGFEQVHLLSQKKLAEKYLVGKRVNIFSGENEKTLSNVGVISIQNPRDETVLFEVGLPNFFSSAIISEKMKIQILGDIS